MAEQKTGYMAEQKTGYIAEQKTGYMAEQKTGNMAEQKTGNMAEQKTGYMAEQKTGYMAEQKTGYMAEQKTGNVAEQKTGYMAEQKTAVVTGAARGLGKGFVTALLDKGYKVHFCDIDTNEGTNTAVELSKIYGEKNINFRTCDVAQEEDLKEFFDEVIKASKTIDVMVNNAGIVDENNWKKCINVDMTASISATYFATDYMKISNGGRGGVIINVASIAGVIAVPPCPVYCACKHAVVGFTRSMAELPDIYNNGIRIVCMCPSTVDTGIVTDMEHKVKDVALLKNRIKALGGKMNVDRIVKTFVKVLEDNDNNGKALVVLPDSMYYQTFPDISSLTENFT